MSQGLRKAVGSFLLVGLLLVVLWALFAFAPSGGSPPTEIQVTGGEIESNETAVWAWTQATMGRETDVTPEISIEDLSDADVSSGDRIDDFESFLLGLGPRWHPEGHPAAVAGQPDRVGIHEEQLPQTWNRTATARFDELLAHEFAHLVQYDSEAYLDSRSAAEGTDDERLAFLALSEGSATHVADQYANYSTTGAYRQGWTAPNASVTERYMLWPYVRGAAYTDARLDDPANVWSLYEDPPESTATILRGDAPGDGPPERAVSMELDDYDVWRQSRVGAAFVDSALAGSIGADRARAVAADWRWGTTVRVRATERETRPNRWVWITEWRDEAAADDFESGLTAFMNDRWSRTNGTWNLDGNQPASIQRVDETAVALAIASDSFRANATVTTTAEGYTISPASTNASASPTANTSTSSVIDASTSSAADASPPVATRRADA